ncbi:MAG TPA: hypothetical protein VKP30_03990 [Polyangiaceae bacterium]|nr:hypothetical protein [Polyangiaceae bacterium]
MWPQGTASITLFLKGAARPISGTHHALLAGMNTTMKHCFECGSINVECATSPAGKLVPKIQLDAPPDASPRCVKAALFHLASKVELLTPPSESWAMRIARDSGAVYLVLAHGTSDECRRALTVLESAALWASREA